MSSENPYYEDKDIVNQIKQGNTLEVLKKIRSKRISCCVTSPPYWQKRNYGTNPVVWDAPKEGCDHEWGDYIKRVHQGGGNSGVPEEWQRKSREDNTGANSGRYCKKCHAWEGELGLEPTPEEFCRHLADVFDEVYRVLRDDGVCFVNLDDTMRDKEMLMVPEMFAMEMRRRGWKLRRKLMWLKTNPLRRPDKDTFVHTWEYVFQFFKKDDYFFDTQYEPYSEATLKQFEKEYNGKGTKNYAEQGIQDPSEIKRRMIASGKNAKGAIMTDVIVTSVSHWEGSHTATYPPQLIEPLVKAGCPEYICKKCGKPRERTHDQLLMPTRPGENISQDVKSRAEDNPYKEIHNSVWSILKPRVIRIETGFTDCGCNEGWEAGLLLDPFMGTGTTAEVAIRNRRNFVGIEINPVTIAESEKRLGQLIKDMKEHGKQTGLEGFT